MAPLRKLLTTLPTDTNDEIVQPQNHDLGNIYIFFFQGKQRANVIYSTVNCWWKLFKCHKLLIISPGLILVQKAFLLGLFSEELIFGGAYYWKEFCVSKWVGLDNKNGLKYRKIPIISPGLIFVQKAFLLGLFSGELIFGGSCYRKQFCVSKWVWLFKNN